MGIHCMLFYQNLKKTVEGRVYIYEAIFKPGTRLPIEGKIGEQSEPRDNLRRRKGGHLWAAAGLAPIFFVFDPVFCPFPTLQSLVPG